MGLKLNLLARALGVAVLYPRPSALTPPGSGYRGPY